MHKFNLLLDNYKLLYPLDTIVHKPVFYNLSQLEDNDDFAKLLETPGLMVYDEMFDQLKELMKYKTPSRKFNEEELEALVFKHIAPLSLNEYGVWVYYPWSNRLVHLLDR